MANTNSFRQVGAGTTFLSPTDFIVQVDTSAGAVKLILPKTSTILDSYTTIFQYMGIRFVDVSNNASINNITIEGFETNKINGETSFVLNTNGAGGIFTLIGADSWSYNANSNSGGGGGGSAPVEVVYADLYSSIVNSTLVAGQKYRLTDYKSVNFLNGWTIALSNPTPIDPSFDPRQIYTGDNEVLILEAISNYELNVVCNSENYSGDVLEFQAYTNKIGLAFDIYNGQTLPDSSVVSNFDLQWDGANVYFDMPTGYPALFGQYFYLYAEFNDGINDYYQDGTFEPLTPVIATCQYPYTNNTDNPKPMSRLSVSADGMKVILLDFVESDVTNYTPDSLYVDTVYAIGDAYGCVTRRNDTERNINVPFDFRARKYRRYEVDLSSLNTSFALGYYGQGDIYKGVVTTGLYKDLFSFGNLGDAKNVQWSGAGGYNMYNQAGYSDNNVFLNGFSDNVLGDIVFDNSIQQFTENNIDRSGSFINNAINGKFINNIINSNFYDNILGAMGYNNFGKSFINNNIINGSNNIIGYNFSSNKIGKGFSNNTIRNVFASNTIADDFVLNTIADGFSNNTIGNNFGNNATTNTFDLCIISSNFTSNMINCKIGSVDFTSATHVYGNYGCTIERASNGTTRLIYDDGVTATLVIVSPTS
jgi:hypothetical protein